MAPHTELAYTGIVDALNKLDEEFVLETEEQTTAEVCE